MLNFELPFECNMKILHHFILYSYAVYKTSPELVTFEFLHTLCVKDLPKTDLCEFREQHYYRKSYDLCSPHTQNIKSRMVSGTPNTARTT